MSSDAYKKYKYIKQHYIYFILLYLYIYPPDSQENDGGANT